MAFLAALRCSLAVTDPLGRPVVSQLPVADSSLYDEFAAIGGEFATGAGFQSVSFGPVTTATLILLITDQEVTLKIDGDAAIVFVAKTLFVHMSETGLTQLDLENTSGSVANVRGYVFGT